MHWYVNNFQFYGVKRGGVLNAYGTSLRYSHALERGAVASVAPRSGYPGLLVCEGIDRGRTSPSLGGIPSRFFLFQNPRTIICRKNSKVLHHLKRAIRLNLTRPVEPIRNHTSTLKNATMGLIGVLKRGVSQRPTMVLRSYTPNTEAYRMPLMYRMAYSSTFSIDHPMSYGMLYTYPMPISYSILYIVLYTLQPARDGKTPRISHRERF